MTESVTQPTMQDEPAPPEEFVARLRAQGTRYHHLHPFHRRMDVVVDFPLPDATQRWAIWRLHLPESHDVDPELMQSAVQRCALTGGQIRNAASHLLEQLGTKPTDYTYAVFHQPNTRFPQAVAKQLGFTPQQISPGLLAPKIGNTYSAAALLGLCAVLDIAQPGETIFVASYGSGSGSDAYALHVTNAITERRALAPLTAAYLAREKFIDYAVYAKWRGKLVME